VWLLLLALAVGVGAWWWFTPPETLRLVKIIPLPSSAVLKTFYGEPAFYGVSDCLCLRLDERQPAGPATITCLGWDGQPRWNIRFTTPLGAWTRNYDKRNPPVSAVAALSQDSHVFALVRIDAQCLRVTSWRDGRLLGHALIPWPPARSAPGSLQLIATNSGRIWCSGWNMLWAIDGNRVASGRCMAVGNISPNGTKVFSYGNTTLDCVLLSVQGDQVQMTKRATFRIPLCSFHWLDDEWAQGFLDDAEWPNNIALIGPSGVLPRTREGEGIWQRPSPGGWWTVPTNRTIRSHWFSTDGRAVLVEEGELKRPRLLRPLLPQSLINQFTLSRLAVYMAPGRLRAVAPMSIWPNRVSWAWLSPDGHYVAALVEGGNNQEEIRVYGWGAPDKVKR
jgi:hypothetical protein